MRIVSPSAKVSYIIVGFVVLVLATLLIGAASDVTASGIVSIVLQLAWVLVGTRIFRGDGEPVAPSRAWWRMTAKPTAGFILAALFAASGAMDVVQAASDPTVAVVFAFAAAVSFLIALAYLQSSMRLLGTRELA